MKMHGGFVSHVALAIACTISADTLAQSQEDHQKRDEHRSPWELGVDDQGSPEGRDELERAPQQMRQQLDEDAKRQAEEEASIQRQRLFPEKDDDPLALDSRPTRKVYGIDNRGDRELYPELIIEPSIYDRYEVYETDRDGLKKWEPKAIIKQGLNDRYEVYKTDRDGLAVDEPHLIIEENVYGDHKVYKTDRYGMPEDIPSRVIKTDALGRQEVYNTDRYGMPIGDPIDEKILE